MKVFISWSGERSRDFALFLRGWLRQVVQAVQPFMSEHDIGKGSRNIVEMAQELQSVQFGIVVVTRDTVAAPWINFEAGAISRSIATGRLVPLLLDIGKPDVAGPLSQFQAVDANNEDDVVGLFREINRRLDQPLESEVLLPAVYSHLPAFHEALARYRESAAGTDPTPALRSEREVLDEVLLILRGLRDAPPPPVYQLALRDEQPALPASRMDWTKRLRRIDDDLVGGHISVTEYRRRRDELLAEIDSDRHGDDYGGPQR
jgi:hypothetical protein